MDSFFFFFQSTEGTSPRLSKYGLSRQLSVSFRGGFSCRVSEARGDDGSSGGWCRNYCVSVMDGVVKRLPRRNGPPCWEGSPSLLRQRRAHSNPPPPPLHQRLQTPDWDCAAPTGAASLSPLGFHSD